MVEQGARTLKNAEVGHKELSNGGADSNILNTYWT